MKSKIIYLIVVLAWSITTSNAQKWKNEKLPEKLKLDNSEIPSYQMTTDYLNYDFYGNFRDKIRISGIATYESENDSGMWKEVFKSHSKDLNGNFPRGGRINYMENFKYIPGEHIITETFFHQIPEADMFVKNLFWDLMGFDVFAYTFWDSLHLNTEFSSHSINSVVDIAGDGFFENKDIGLTWIGYSKMNNELCAIIKFSAMNNPLKIEMENMSLSGRSHYWGEVYVSLKDKQIEYANLKEDVLTDIKISGHDQNMMGYTVRNINLTRIQ